MSGSVGENRTVASTVVVPAPLAGGRRSGADRIVFGVDVVGRDRNQDRISDDHPFGVRVGDRWTVLCRVGQLQDQDLAGRRVAAGPSLNVYWTTGDRPHQVASDLHLLTANRCLDSWQRLRR